MSQRTGSPHDLSHEPPHQCAEVPELQRLNYFFGQMLSVQDFRGEQSYFREKLKLHNRCFHGYGTVCGLLVRPAPEESPCESEADRKRRELTAEIEKLRALLDRERAQQAAAAAATAPAETPAAQGQPAQAEAVPAQAATAAPANAAASPNTAGPVNAAASPNTAAPPNAAAPPSTAAPAAAPTASPAQGDVEIIREMIERLERERACLPPGCPAPPVRPKVIVECGIAVDCEGNEIVVRRTETVDLWSKLCLEEQRELGEHHREVYLSICFCEKAVSPVRPLLGDSCDPRPECTFGKLQDSYRFHVSFERPEPDRRCESCCSTCENPCLLLARIGCVGREGSVDPHHIHNGVRRMLSRYDSTRIDGINWTHGAEYWIDEADALLSGPDGGLVIQTTHAVRASTLRPGVVDVWVVKGGAGERTTIYQLDTEIVTEPHEFVKRFRVRYTGDELLDNGDRVLVQVRGAFILDRCCQPLDGVNVGGFVPILPDREFERFERHVHHPCVHDAYGPPRSGIGIPGGSTFESWFYVKRRHDEHGNRRGRNQGI